jgi:Protein kinase domain
MTDYRRKTTTMSSSLLQTPTHPTSPSPENGVLHLTDCPFNLPTPCSPIVGNSFLFDPPHKKKVPDTTFPWSPDKRARRNTLHTSQKLNVPAADTSPSLKRSDVVILNLDQASLGSPVAKRPPKRMQQATPRKPSKPLHNLLHQQVQAQEFEFSTPLPGNKVSRRISLDTFLRPMTRDSPFNTLVPLADSSVHPRPTTFSTPPNFKFAKPLQAAFMSEGLLSKRNRSDSISTKHMPDTPCKRPVSGTFSEYEPPTPTKPGGLWGTLVSPEREVPRRLEARLTGQEDRWGVMAEKFDECQVIGSGEFSEVYQVTDRVTRVKYAVKRTRYPISGVKERHVSEVRWANCSARRMEEVRTLKRLGRQQHIVEFISSWDQFGHLYIQTELCENGSLDVFLRDYGNIERLDEFRVWKILLELSLVSAAQAKF